ncbi:MAG: RagB/SusD family nutrient uptake outer membrane protein, partial [Muribaculaceae bacterium]|nr:RagB/SusD family nutrient uptake outer membrane protein [Muribaculaceae bacterium]
SNDPGLYYERDSREYVMQQMLKDIDFAIEKLPVKEKESAAPYRVTKGAALALKSCFCLFEGTFRKYHNLDIPNGVSASGEAYESHDWKYYLDQCVDASEKLMSGNYGSYKLFTTGNPDSDYITLFAQQNASKDEFILAVKYDQGIKILHNANAHAIQPSQGMPGYTRKFVCSYLMKDGSRFTDKPGWQTMIFKDEMVDRDPRLAQSIRGLGYHRFEQNEVISANYEGSVTGYHPHKFVSAPGPNGGDWDKNNNSSNDLPEFRYGEILLNYAEAKAELGTLTQDDLDKTVNALRNRVGMAGKLNLASANANPDPYLDGDISPESGYFNVSGANKGVILEIRRERAIELVQEGRRWNDLMRWKCGKMIDQPLTGNYFPGPGKYDLTGDGKPNLILYASGDAKPAAENNAVVWEIGKNINLTENSYGYKNYHDDQKLQYFNEERDYLYPIPSDEINLNPNLKQNPKW